MLDVTEDMMTDMMEDSGGYDGGDDRVQAAGHLLAQEGGQLRRDHETVSEDH